MYTALDQAVHALFIIQHLDWMKLTVLIVALNVFEELAEACAEGRVPFHTTQSGAHPVCGKVCADLIVLSLQTHTL